MKTPHIRCKCRKCGRTQVIKIQEYLAGAKCILGKSIKAPDFNCAGNLEYFSDDSEDAITNSANVLLFLRNEYFPNEKLGELVDTVADDISHWLEGVQSPQEMGWVGQDGQP